MINEIKITNKKQLINILKDIQRRADVYSNSYTMTKLSIYEESISTLIKVLEESK